MPFWPLPDRLPYGKKVRLHSPSGYSPSYGREYDGDLGNESLWQRFISRAGKQENTKNEDLRAVVTSYLLPTTQSASASKWQDELVKEQTSHEPLKDISCSDVSHHNGYPPSHRLIPHRRYFDFYRFSGSYCFFNSSELCVDFTFYFPLLNLNWIPPFLPTFQRWNFKLLTLDLTSFQTSIAITVISPHYDVCTAPWRIR